MLLAHESLQAPSSFKRVVSGAFSGSKPSQILGLTDTTLVLFAPDENGELRTLVAQNAFAGLRDACVIRPVGSRNDLVVLVSDSGAVSLLAFDEGKARFVPMDTSIFGKSGARRTVAGQYVVADRQGRAVMVAAVEGQKLFFSIRSGEGTNSQFGSPVEQVKTHSVTYCVSSVESTSTNTRFVALERSYADRDNRKFLVLYEFDAGLKTVTRKALCPVNDLASSVVQTEGGVLVVGQGTAAFYPVSGAAVGTFDQEKIMTAAIHAVLPHGVVAAVCPVRTKTVSSVLVQVDSGELVSVEVKEGELLVSALEVLPVMSSLWFVRPAFLFAAYEVRDHCFYQLDGLGTETFILEPLSSKRNLAPVRNFVVDPADSSSLILSRDGSSLGKLQLRKPVKVLASSELPGRPTAVWTLDSLESGSRTEFLAFSFLDSTLILRVGEEVEEVKDAGFLLTTPSIFIGRLMQASGTAVYVQVTASVIRVFGSKGFPTEINTKKGVVAATGSETQILVGCEDGFVTLYELDRESGELVSRAARQVGSSSSVRVISLCLAPGDGGSGQFAAVCLSDKSCRVLSLAYGRGLKQVSAVSLESVGVACSLLPVSSAFELFVGTSKGLLQRFALESSSGSLAPISQAQLGHRSVSLSTIGVDSSLSLVACAESSTSVIVPKSWGVEVTKLAHTFEHVCLFKSDFAQEGVLGVNGATLTIGTLSTEGISLETAVDLGADSVQTTVRLASGGLAVLVCAVSGDFQVRLLDASQSLTSTFSFEGGVSVAHLSSCVFPEIDGEFLLAACSDSLQMLIIQDNQLSLVHKTVITDDLKPLRMAGFVRRTILASFQPKARSVGLGQKASQSCVRVYELGRKQLLLKAEFSSPFHSGYNGLFPVTASPGKFWAIDICYGAQLFEFSEQEFTLKHLAQDCVQRWSTAGAVLDQGRVLLMGDKFGDLVIHRLDAGRIAKENQLKHAVCTLTPVAQFHVGHVATCFRTIRDSFTGAECVVYSTIDGAFGSFRPFSSRTDATVLQTLQTNMEDDSVSLAGRDGLSFRSQYASARSVIDVDFCREFAFMGAANKDIVLKKLDMSDKALIALLTSSSLL